MSSTSERRRSFAAEPIRGKSVTELVGVGKTLGRKLEAARFNTVNFVYFHYNLKSK